jgi:tRNA U34 5-methylaminomethyl-2-thiouridine-forming methyltransferase MnmC
MVPKGPLEAIPRTTRQNQRRLRRPEIDELVAGYQAGATTYELAERFRLHRVTVSAVLRRNGVALRAQPLSPTQIATATQFYHEGLSLLKVGERVGCDAETVRQALTKAGVGIRPRNGWSGRERQTVCHQ